MRSSMGGTRGDAVSHGAPFPRTARDVWAGLLAVGLLAGLSGCSLLPADSGSAGHRQRAAARPSSGWADTCVVGNWRLVRGSTTVDLGDSTLELTTTGERVFTATADGRLGSTSRAGSALDGVQRHAHGRGVRHRLGDRDLHGRSWASGAPSSTTPGPSPSIVARRGGRPAEDRRQRGQRRAVVLLLRRRDGALASETTRMVYARACPLTRQDPRDHDLSVAETAPIMTSEVMIGAKRRTDRSVGAERAQWWPPAAACSLRTPSARCDGIGS